MKPHPCFETNKALEDAARRAEQRKNQAISELVKKLGCGQLGQATADPTGSGRSASFARGKASRCESGR